MLARLKRETQSFHAGADADRLSLRATHATLEGYRDYLIRIYGFEAPTDAAFSMTVGLDELLDLRTRTQLRLLKADLLVLGVESTSELPLCRTIFPFRRATDALGWMYVTERNSLASAELRRYLQTHLPNALATAGAYLAGGERSVGTRLTELGIVLDQVAHNTETAEQIISAARDAFRRQRHWFAQLMPPRRRRPSHVA